MRLARIDIPAFGPFTDWQLGLPEPGSVDGADLHLLHGPNEAGKSSLLRAIHQLLYGIPARSDDGFLHDYPALRIGAELVAADGRRLILFRRKGNKDTLLDQDGKVLPDAALKPFLGAVDEGYFSSMFGMGVADLRAGAGTLLQGEGELGRALFSASLGGSDVQAAMQKLADEADGLFRPRGRMRLVNEAVASHRDAARRSRDLSVRPEDWRQLESELKAAEERRNELQQQHRERLAQREWWQRCRDALTPLGHWDDLEEQWQRVAGLPEVADDFGDAVRRWEQRRHQLQARASTLGERLAELEKQRRACQWQPLWLDAVDRIRELHEGRSRQEEQLQRIEDGRRELERGREALSRQLADLQLPDDVAGADGVRIDKPRELRGREAAQRLDDLAARRQRNRERLSQLAGELERRRSELDTLPPGPSDDLRAALAAARPLAGLVSGLADAGQRLREARVEQQRGRQRLRPAPEAALADDAALAAAAVPGRSEIQGWQQRFDEHKRRLKELTREQRDLLELLERVDQELERLGRGGELPSEEQLAAARRQRDELWEQWSGGMAAGETEAWRGRFAAAIAAADELADRLYGAAQAVAEAGQARQRRRQLVTTHERLTREHEELTAGHDRDLAKWRRLWQGLVAQPGTPAEMQEWREGWQEFAAAVHNGDDLAAEINTGTQQLAAVAGTLAAALSANDPDAGTTPPAPSVGAAGEGAGAFTALLRRAEQRVEEGNAAAGRRLELDRGLREAGEERAALEREWQDLEKDWSEALKAWRDCCRDLHLPADTSPKAGLVLIQERRELARAIEDWQRLQAEVDDLEQRTRAFAAEIDGQAAALGVDVEGWRERLSGLWAGCQRALEARREHDRLSEEEQQQRQALEDLKPELEAGRLEQQAFQQQAGVDSLEALMERLPRLEERIRLQRQQRALRDSLTGLARGEGLEHFLDRLRAEPADQLPARIAEVDAKLAELDEQLEQARKDVADLEQQRRELERAGDAAAAAAQEAEMAAAAAVEHGRRYVRLRVAVALMEQQIEDYRRQHQGPLMERSGEWFRRITGDSFSGLTGEEDKPGHIVLMGLRASGSRVPVTGMSEGTRDQLYLALRLAALQHYLDDPAHEPMPLILDDLLMTFDDQRAAAVLRALHELSRRTQVLLFTHHQHLVQLASDTLGTNAFGCHPLQGTE